MELPAIREITTGDDGAIVYSFCTLVTRLAEYREMVDAFARAGFSAGDCEFLYVDNSDENRFDAFAAYNRFLLQARGRYVILCHQDILPRGRGRADLDALLADLTVRAPAWGVCGNAGVAEDGKFAVALSHPDEDFDVGGPFPVRVVSLDENFLLVRRAANLALSRDLSGFHWYGSDLCVIADVLGWEAHVIDFRVLHKSTGNIRGDFRERGRQFRLKYAKAFRPRWQHVVTSQPVYLSSSRVQTWFHRAGNSIRWRIAAIGRRLRAGR